MDFDELRKYISDKGYRTLSELKDKYDKEDQEILISNLAFMLSKNKVMCIKFQNNLGETDSIYFNPTDK